MTVLVLTNEFDPTADLVISRLNEAGVPVFRTDTADFPESLCLSARLDPVTGSWQGELRGEHRTVDLADIRSVYYRRPTVFRTHPGMSETETSWVLQEARHGFAGVLDSLPARWVNHPQADAAASLKPGQLRAAARAGLHVPDTLVTNHQETAAAFLAAQPHGRGVAKSFGGPPTTEAGELVSLPTRVIGFEEVTGGVARTAHQFQAWAPKAADVRLIAVADQQFACRIDAASSRGRVDYRDDYGHLSYAPLYVPEDVRKGVESLMAGYGLAYGALDFVLDDEGGWTFLEINPTGQFGFVSLKTSQPIAEAIADLLATEAS